MDCRELIEYLSEYFDGGLDSLERERFEKHLDDCEDCAAYLDSFRTTLKLLKISRNEDSALSTMTIPAPLRALILAARNLG